MNFNWKLTATAALLGMVLPTIIISAFGGKTSRSKPILNNTDPNVLSQNVQVEETIDVLKMDGNVQKMDMNDYLTSVVLCEMPADFELEALKAQSVVARTYALRRRESGSKHTSAAVCTDSGCCQGYRAVSDYLAAGGAESAVEKIKLAVKETQGLVLIYGGDLIDATYFSCSGGKTEDAAAVWGSDVPYLRSTESPGEEAATYYTDSVQFSKDEFCAKLGRQLSGNPATWLESVSYTAGGGVDVMRLCGVAYKGTELRSLLGLRSTAFILTAVGDTITITTKGFGHRVGMSQYGADAMAVQGYSFEQILLHYYQGTELVNYHDE